MSIKPNLFSDFLLNNVGNALENNPEDIRTTKRNLANAGYFNDETENDYLTRQLDDSIRKFQKDRGLRVDGILRPGGETERGLFGILSGLAPEKIFDAADDVWVTDATGRVTTPPYFPEQKREEKRSKNILVQLGLMQDPNERFPMDEKDPSRPKPFGDMDTESSETAEGDIISPDPVSEPDSKENPESAPNTDTEGTDEKPEPTEIPDSGQAEEKDAPNNTEISQAEIEKAEGKVQNDLNYLQKNEHNFSAKLLKHYIGKSGQDYKMPIEEIEKSPVYQDAMKINETRFEQSITQGFVDKEGGPKSPLKDQILNMKDGETVKLINPQKDGQSEYWDRDIKRSEGITKDQDRFFSIGATKMRSTGDLQATRHGDKIEISGTVRHTIKDRYDFNDDTVFDKLAFKHHRLLATAGKAEPFNIEGTKEQPVTGVLEIKNGKITNAKFQWGAKKMEAER
ncbi:peptidoglycan-binding domain-containing protein [Micavibrio aeruginosavorus]|uniref:Peptidoglycan binding-like domain-containing protein n=1 Tax=Micavibrio aeruginosavorus EPB TaxID=349215 RepID=M4VIV3_9BACT|nr:peptidoglycan-binding domain-containing protein [Micavibrio aeruginosavorus]AGH98425.1 hypothetical protein A11S_1621 [Micavibrio aeruginosavorus EPB]